MSAVAPTCHDRVHEAVRRRLRDAKGPTVRIPVRKLAAEIPANRRQVLRALRELDDAGLLDATFLGPHSGAVVIGRRG